MKLGHGKRRSSSYAQAGARRFGMTPSVANACIRLLSPGGSTSCSPKVTAESLGKQYVVHTGHDVVHTGQSLQKGLFCAVLGALHPGEGSHQG